MYVFKKFDLVERRIHRLISTEIDFNKSDGKKRYYCIIHSKPSRAIMTKRLKGKQWKLSFLLNEEGKKIEKMKLNLLNLLYMIKLGGALRRR